MNDFDLVAVSTLLLTFLVVVLPFSDRLSQTDLSDGKKKILKETKGNFISCFRVPGVNNTTAVNNPTSPSFKCKLLKLTDKVNIDATNSG